MRISLDLLCLIRPKLVVLRLAPCLHTLCVAQYHQIRIATALHLAACLPLASTLMPNTLVKSGKIKIGALISDALRALNADSAFGVHTSPTVPCFVRSSSARSSAVRPWWLLRYESMQKSSRTQERPQFTDQLWRHSRQGSYLPWVARNPISGSPTVVIALCPTRLFPFLM